MEKIFSKTSKLLFSKQKSIISSAMLLSMMVLGSRFFGFLRYRILASFFNKGQLDIFLASFRVPDFVFEILITGAFTSSFIPIFLKFKRNRESLNENVSSVINLIIVLLFGFITFLFIFMGFIVKKIMPGFSPQQVTEVIFYSRILLLCQLPFLVIGSILTGLGQANKVFFLTALAPIIYNIVIIIVTVLFASQIKILAPVIGVVLGAFLFFFIQSPLLFRSGFRYRFLLKKSKGLVEFVKTTIPRLMTVIVSQIDATVDLTLATFLGSGAYTAFFFAQRLQLLPVSVIGLAFGQASLPYLSEIHQSGDNEGFKKIVVESIANLFFLTVPLMSFFIFARTPMVRLFFGGQKFDWKATVDTAMALSFFSLSIPFHSLYYFLIRCFYAFLDTKTPFMINVFSVIVNTSLSIFFIVFLKKPIWFLSISFSIAITLNVIILFFLLEKRLKGFNMKFFVIETTKIVLATIFASVPSYYLMKLLDGLIFDTTRTINVFFLLFLIGLFYFGVYLFLGWFFDTKEMYFISRVVLKAKQYKKRILEIYSSYE